MLSPDYDLGLGLAGGGGERSLLGSNSAANQETCNKQTHHKRQRQNHRHRGSPKQADRCRYVEQQSASSLKKSLKSQVCESELLSFLRRPSLSDGQRASSGAKQQKTDTSSASSNELAAAQSLPTSSSSLCSLPDLNQQQDNKPTIQHQDPSQQASLAASNHKHLVQEVHQQLKRIYGGANGGLNAKGQHLGPLPGAFVDNKPQVSKFLNAKQLEVKDKLPIRSGNMLNASERPYAGYDSFAISDSASQQRFRVPPSNLSYVSAASAGDLYAGQDNYRRYQEPPIEEESENEAALDRDQELDEPEHEQELEPDDEEEEQELLIDVPSVSSSSSESQLRDRKKQLESLHYATATAAALLRETAQSVAAFAASESQHRPTSTKLNASSHDIYFGHEANSGRPAHLAGQHRPELAALHPHPRRRQEPIYSMPNEKHQLYSNWLNDSRRIYHNGGGGGSNSNRSHYYFRPAASQHEFGPAKQLPVLARAARSFPYQSMQQPAPQSLVEVRRQLAQRRIYGSNLSERNAPSLSIISNQMGLIRQQQLHQHHQQRLLCSQQQQQLQLQLQRQRQQKRIPSQLIVQTKPALVPQMAGQVRVPPPLSLVAMPVPQHANMNGGGGVSRVGGQPAPAKSDLMNRMLVSNLISAQLMSLQGTKSPLNHLPVVGPRLLAPFLHNQRAAQQADIYGTHLIATTKTPSSCTFNPGNKLHNGDFKKLTLIERICRIDLTLFWSSLLILFVVLMGSLFAVTHYFL